MSFKLTYSTMFNPPPELHTQFDAAMQRVKAGIGATQTLHVDGTDRRAPRTFAKLNPADQQQLIGQFASATPADVDSAVQAAHRAHASWKRTPVAERLRLLRKVGKLIEDRVYDIAAALTLEVGKNRMEALGEAQETADFFFVYCDDFERQQGFVHGLPNDPLTTHVSHNRSVMKPYGVWAVIAPFNFPLALAGGPTAAALVTGNTVVLKGATATPWAGRLLADCIRDAGLPPGVFNYLSGSSREVGEPLVNHPLTAGITFTGSHEVGMRITRTMQSGAYPRPCIAEMGGKNPCIVTHAADLERAATGILRSAYGMGGQKCSALSRLYVHRNVADDLIARLQKLIAALAIGDPALQKNWLGPVTTTDGYADYANYAEQLRRGESRVIAGGTQLRDGDLARGLYVQPMLAESPLDHPLWRHEMFLPVLMVHRVASNDDAMRLANDTSLGLTAGFYGSADEVSWFQEHIEAGVTYANRPQGATTGAWPGYQPFGGWKGSGNTGKAIASFYYLPQYLREQSQTVVD